MEKKTKKRILLELDQNHYDNLLWLSDKLGLPVVETLRLLIPKFPLEPPALIDDPSKIRDASPFAIVPISPGVEKEELKGILDAITATEAATTLVKEVRQQLIEKEQPGLSVFTYKRLGRWCRPYRQTEREFKVKPLAEKLSKLLFGTIIDRLD